MGTGTCTSVEAVKGSVDSYSLSDTVAGEVTKNRKTTGKEPLRRYLAEPQRSELVACGFATTPVHTAPREDVRAMKKKLKAIVRKFSGSEIGSK